MYLYLLTNTVNGKQYVGITSRPVKKRLLEHLQSAARGTTHIARAIKKYGREVFTMRVIGDASDWAALCEAEQVAILNYNTFTPHGYNLTRGGEGSTGYQQSPEHRAKIGAAQQGERNHRYGKTPAHQAKMVEAANLRYAEQGHPMKGKQLPAAHKAKLSKALKGRTYSEAEREAHSKAMMGHAVSEETREKIGAGLKEYYAINGHPMQGHVLSAETKQRISVARMGQPTWNTGVKTGPLSEEHRARISTTLKGHPAWNKGLPWHAMRGGVAHPKARAVEYDGQRYPSVMACHRATGIARNTIRAHIAAGKARYVDDE